MYLVPLVRTGRAIAACTIMPDNPLFAIGTSEIISYTLPFINNDPVNAMNDMILFLLYYFNYYECADDIIFQFEKKYLKFYQIESITLLVYLFIYFITL